MPEVQLIAEAQAISEHIANNNLEPLATWAQ